MLVYLLILMVNIGMLFLLDVSVPLKCALKKLEQCLYIMYKSQYSVL
jgi:hypothetical protein